MTGSWFVPCPKPSPKSARWRAAIRARRSMCWSASCAAAPVSATNTILDRGSGKSTQPSEGSEDQHDYINTRDMIKFRRNVRRVYGFPPSLLTETQRRGRSACNALRERETRTTESSLGGDRINELLQIRDKSLLTCLREVAEGSPFGPRTSKDGLCYRFSGFVQWGRCAKVISRTRIVVTASVSLTVQALQPIG